MKTYQLILLAVVVFGLAGYLVGSKFVTQNWDYFGLIIKATSNPIDVAATLIQKEVIVGLYFDNTTKDYITGFSLMNSLVSRVLSEKAGVKTISFGVINGKCIPPFSNYDNMTNSSSPNSSKNNTLFDPNDPVFKQAVVCSNPVIVIRRGNCNCVTVDSQIIIEGDSTFLNSKQNILSLQDFLLEVAKKVKK